MAEHLDRNLGLELVRVTEAAALAAGRWMGQGNKEAADQAAVDAMRYALETVDMDGVVVIGEGEKDEAPMLYIGEQIGNGQPPRTDIAVDPIDGTTLLSKGLPNAMAVVALAERGSMYYPPNIVYMEKIAVGPAGRGRISILASPAENLKALADAKDCDISDLTVIILDRPRHENLIRQVRDAGARIKLISDGDVAGALIAAMEEHTGVDLLMGIGGAPEAVIAACALKCVDGDMQCRLWPRSEEEKQAAIARGLDPSEFERVLTIDDLCASDNVFFAATGITNGELLRGVQYYGRGARTYSLSMRSRSGTARWIEAQHRWERLMAYTGSTYDQEIWRDRTRAKTRLTDKT
ncbi:MAG TPA: class II fructose-bisphosphatase [Chloroflexota bacterium]|nr:class II fructose-bisphosphatase [Chloroflexota bacterium]